MRERLTRRRCKIARWRIYTTIKYDKTTYHVPFFFLENYNINIRIENRNSTVRPIRALAVGHPSRWHTSVWRRPRRFMKNSIFFSNNNSPRIHILFIFPFKNNIDLTRFYFLDNNYDHSCVRTITSVSRYIVCLLSNSACRHGRCALLRLLYGRRVYTLHNTTRDKYDWTKK